MNRPKGVIGVGILVAGIGLLATYLVFTNALQPGCFAGYCAGHDMKLGSTTIPFGTAFAIANLCLWLGFALAILGTGLAVLGDWEKGGRVKEPKAVESATCGNCNAAVHDDALRCPSCGVEFGP